MEKQRDIYLHHSRRTIYDISSRMLSVETNGRGDGVFGDNITKLYIEFVEYIAGMDKSQFTNESIALAKEILRITDNAKFKAIETGFLLVDKFSPEGEETQCQKE